MNTTDKINVVLAAIAKIHNHPYTDIALTLEEDNDETLPWLPAGNIANGHLPQVPEDYKQLCVELLSALEGNLIGPDGQHSDVFYEMRRMGYKLRTGESDSWGPLSSVFTHDSYKWRVCYG